MFEIQSPETIDKFRRDLSQHFNKCKSKMEQDQMFGGASVLCWLAAPLQMFYWNLLGNKVQSWFSEMSDQWRVSLYMAISQNAMGHLGEGDFIIFD